MMVLGRPEKTTLWGPRTGRMAVVRTTVARSGKTVTDWIRLLAWIFNSAGGLTRRGGGTSWAAAMAPAVRAANIKSEIDRRERAMAILLFVSQE